MRLSVFGLLPALRRRILRSVNDRISRRSSATLDAGRTPSYIVVTPHLVHLAPLAASNHSAGIQPVFVANGIGRADMEWLAEMRPDVPVISLRASLRGDSASLLEHGVVINHLASGSHDAFCVQDADCFVTDSEFWSTMRLDPDTDYAVGPFLRQGEGERPDFPETFLICLNRKLMDQYAREFGITAEPSGRPRRRARRFLSEAGYPEGKYLETLKDYYDTLQQFWVAARKHGFGYRHVAGEGETVHHVGGTSYLHRSFENLDHWDYWPLNVHYFHLRLLELPRCAQFRERFRGLIEFHGSSTSLLAAFPDYDTGWRRQESDLIISRTNAAALFGSQV